MTNKKLTILHTESSTGWAGQEMRIIMEAREMKKLGHNIVLAVQPESGIIPAIEKDGFKKETLTMKKELILYSIFRLVRIIAQYDVDIVNTHSSWDSWVASLAGRLSRSKPVILRTRHLSTPVSTGFMSRIVYQYLPHLVITTGDSIRNALINKNRYPEDKIISIPTGVDLNAYYPREMNYDMRAELGIARDAKVITTVAALRSWKGHDYLLEAAKIMIEKRNDIIFLIAGDGPRRNHLNEKASSLGIQDYVRFLGFRSDVPEVLSTTDVFVLPSYANEGVPQAILQAMAMEKPVVASAAGSIPEIVRDKETGVLVETRNPLTLAAGIELVLDNPGEAVKTALRARQLIESKYSLGAMLEQIGFIYDKFTNSLKDTGNKDGC
jgi:glycosyltransferase involved in cell wall biosynthesis